MNLFSKKKKDDEFIIRVSKLLIIHSLEFSEILNGKLQNIK